MGFSGHYQRKRNRHNEDNELEEAMAEYGMQNKSLDKSIQLIEQMKDVGIGALGMLSEQRDIIKRVHDTVVGMASSLGVSQSTIRKIENRYFRDKIMIYVGMCLITLLLIFIYFFMF